MIELMMLFLLASGAQKKVANPPKPVAIADGDSEPWTVGNGLSPVSNSSVAIYAPMIDDGSEGVVFTESATRDMYTGPVILPAPDGTTAIKLADTEYAHLQALRKAVADEEKRLAVRYGAYIAPPYDPAALVRMPTMCDRVGGCAPRASDHYEYHGQFLLIQKGK